MHSHHKPAQHFAVLILRIMLDRTRILQLVYHRCYPGLIFGLMSAQRRHGQPKPQEKSLWGW